MKSCRPRIVGRKPLPPPTPTKGRRKQKDPAEVYCRIRPLRDLQDVACVRPVGNTLIQLSSPDPTNVLRNGVIKETQYTFKFVFDDFTSQKALFDHAALPLVEDLLNGKNGLLFTYGVTGSGKTFTMTGTPQDGGLLPRSLDVIFNSLGSLQADKYIFKPDRLNGFDVQSQADAMIDRQKDYITSLRSSKTPKRKDLSDNEDRVPDQTKVDCVDEDSSYSVFVQYIEIYNNYVYDLLEDVPIDPVKPRPPQSKMLREDSTHNMYIHCATEIEVKSTEDAFDAFYKGQKRRRVAHTTLNTESSRSHSVFTIRLVQAPLDFQGAEVLQEKGTVCISQLSLVDLAGSERTVRTKNSGDRLREAGNINNSLMVLRTCIEVLRENQTSGTNKMVPYRDSKLTHLFKNYFDGEGKVRMIVCVNSSSDDYEENLHILRFAEMVQEVQIARPTLLKPDLGLTPGRRRANIAFKEILDRHYDASPAVHALTAGPMEHSSPTALMLSALNFGPAFPLQELLSPSDDVTVATYIEYLKDREMRRAAKLQEFKESQLNFRSRIIDVEKQSILKDQHIESLTTQLQTREKKITTLEQENNSLSLKLNAYERKRRHLENELDEKGIRLNQEALEKERLKSKMQDNILIERERVTRQLSKKMREKEAEIKTKMWMTNEKMQTLREIISDKWQPAGGGPQEKEKASKSDSKLNVDGKMPPPRRQRSVSPAPLTSRAVVNLRHRRSRSTGSGLCLDHVPPGTVELGTILQPKIRKRRSVSKLTVKDMTKDAAHYVLTHQLQDQRGDIETRYYKGAVLPTSTGGAQVVLNDVETLKQSSPGSRKRTVRGQRLSGESSGEWTDVETRCATGIEGHTNQKRNRV